MRRSASLVLVLLLAACASDVPGEPAEEGPTRFEGTLEGADDGARDAGFAAFRDSLTAVVARRDTAALLGLVAPGARLSFGDTPGGPEGLRQMWLAGTTPADGETVWTVLGHLLTGGSVDEDGAVTVPAAAALWPDTLDAFSYLAIPGTDVAARASASDSSVVARLSRLYVPVTGPAAGGVWPVRLPDGRAAVVATADATSPVGYRATFWDDGAGWRLQSFLRGD